MGDFGVSRVLNGTHQMAHTQVGTPYYLSPEICESRPYNAKSDIWSLGCVLYELTTFRHAFDAKSLKLLVLKIVRGIYPPVSATRYSKGLRELIGAMLQKDPSRRPGINAILERSIVQRRVAKFLTPDEARAEFSHTVLHGKRPLARTAQRMLYVKVPPKAVLADGGAVQDEKVPPREDKAPFKENARQPQVSAIASAVAAGRAAAAGRGAGGSAVRP